MAIITLKKDVVYKIRHNFDIVPPTFDFPRDYIIFVSAYSKTFKVERKCQISTKAIVCFDGEIIVDGAVTTFSESSCKFEQLTCEDLKDIIRIVEKLNNVSQSKFVYNRKMNQIQKVKKD